MSHTMKILLFTVAATLIVMLATSPASASVGIFKF